MIDFKPFTDEKALRAAIKQEFDREFPKPTLEEPPLLSRPQLVEVENKSARFWVEVSQMTNTWNPAFLSLRCSQEISSATLNADEATVLIAELRRGVSDLERALAYQQHRKDYQEKLSDWEQRKRDLEAATVREWRAFMKGETPENQEPNDFEDYEEDDYEEDDDE